MITVHKLQDRLQKMIASTQRRSHKTGTGRATSTAKGNAAYAAMEAVIEARGWQVEAKRVYDQKFAEAAEAEDTYHASIRRTLERTEALEKHVKTVTMRADTLVTTEADFFQTLSTAMRRPSGNSTPSMANCASPVPLNGDHVLPSPSD